MKPYPLPALTIGLDVVSKETGLPKGAVRAAHNVVIENNGDFSRRPGHVSHIELPGAHSLWQSPAQTRVLAAAEDTLYEVDLAGAAVAAAFVGLPFEAPVEYTDIGPDIYFTAGGVLRKMAPDGTIRRPGIANLLGERATLTATVGALPAGRYGVAYTLVNDLGEESGASSIAWIDLSSGGILISGILQGVADVERMNIYVTQKNGDRLYRQANVVIAATATIADDGLNNDIACDRLFLQPLPGGEYVRLFNGRAYTVEGKWLYCSRPLDYGVSDTVSDWMTFNRSITLFEPVAGGIWVGFHDKVLFMRGNGPKDFQLVDAAGSHGAWPHTGCEVPADYFNPDMVPDRATPVACWNTRKGLAIGRADGTLTYPQSGRVLMEAGPGRAAFMQQRGLKQGVFLHESLTMGVDGAVDTTI